MDGAGAGRGMTGGASGLCARRGTAATLGSAGGGRWGRAMQCRAGRYLRAVGDAGAAGSAVVSGAFWLRRIWTCRVQVWSMSAAACSVMAWGRVSRVPAAPSLCQRPRQPPVQARMGPLHAL